MQQFCDIFGKKGNASHIILGDNPSEHGFVLKDLVLIELFQLIPTCVTNARCRENIC